MANAMLKVRKLIRVAWQPKVRLPAPAGAPSGCEAADDDDEML